MLDNQPGIERTEWIRRAALVMQQAADVIEALTKQRDALQVRSDVTLELLDGFYYLFELRAHHEEECLENVRPWKSPGYHACATCEMLSLLLHVLGEETLPPDMPRTAKQVAEAVQKIQRW
jgi:hypothetical protein